MTLRVLDSLVCRRVNATGIESKAGQKRGESGYVLLHLSAHP